MSSNGIREVIIEEALKLLPLAYHSFRSLLEGLNEEQVILLWFLESHKDDYYLRSKLYEELGLVTKEERKRISGLLIQALEKRMFILRLREIDMRRIRSLQREVSVFLAY